MIPAEAILPLVTAWIQVIQFVVTCGLVAAHVVLTRTVLKAAASDSAARRETTVLLSLVRQALDKASQLNGDAQKMLEVLPSLVARETKDRVEKVVSRMPGQVAAAVMVANEEASDILRADKRPTRTENQR